MTGQMTSSLQWTNQEQFTITFNATTSQNSADSGKTMLYSICLSLSIDQSRPFACLLNENLRASLERYAIEGSQGSFLSIEKLVEFHNITTATTTTVPTMASCASYSCWRCDTC